MTKLADACDTASFALCMAAAPNDLQAETFS